MTKSKGWSSRAQRLTIFFYPKKQNHEHINYKEGKCEKCRRQPVTIGMPVFKKPRN